MAGAGIAGLTLALALAKFGAQIVVLERNSAISEYGAGLQISPNARHALNHLGLDQTIADCSFEPSGIDVYPDARQSPLLTLELGAAVRQRYGAPYVVMHRADLVETLYKTCRRFANIDIVFDAQHWEANSEGPALSINVQAAAQRRQGWAFALIGADGVHSHTRNNLLAGPPARYTGRTAWRALVPIAALQSHLAIDRTSMLLGPDFHLIAYPLHQRGQFNLALFINAPEPQTRSTPTPSLGRNTSQNPRLAAVMAAVADQWGAWPLYTVDTQKWFEGPIGLIGDAAHAMEPFQAQGAAMAIEDAAVLAPLLISQPDAATAFAQYQNARQPRVRQVMRTSHANGQIFHMHWPWTIGRDMAMKAQGPTGHFRRLDWLYGHKVAQSGQNM
ncbi:FAD-dependent monooxygenase [Devosia rhodophyticola]|uniref:FAD-dependent monooxygenase n=1 Tax=Devosia rhodophyticola TaxID=3026423 RepID=A0ABY7Z1S1_9HYPH|nr:FAD-dependent monooxygenase [Devosia rhodophyticola]